MLHDPELCLVGILYVGYGYSSFVPAEGLGVQCEVREFTLTFLAYEPVRHDPGTPRFRFSSKPS